MRAKLWPVRPSVHPTIGSYFHQEVVDWIKGQQAKRHYKVAIVEELSLAHYIPVLKAAGCKVIYDAHNVEGVLRATVANESASEGAGKLQERWRRRLLNARLVAEEVRAVKNSDLVWACSLEDAEFINSAYRPARPVAVIPSGLEMQAYRRAGVIEPGADWSNFPLTIVFPATFSYFPNQDAARRLVEGLLPLLRERGCDPRIIFVGRNPTALMQEWSRKDNAITVTGSVESVLPYLELPCIVALPITIGSGTRLKILEAFAVGRPIVTTAKGVEGILAEDGRHLVIREGLSDMADAVIAVWRDHDLRARICANALDLMQKEYSWEAAGEHVRQNLETHEFAERRTVRGIGCLQPS